VLAAITFKGYAQIGRGRAIFCKNFFLASHENCWASPDNSPDRLGLRQNQAEMMLEAGSHAVRVVRVYKGIRRVDFESEIEVPANRVKVVPVESKR